MSSSDSSEEEGVVRTGEPSRGDVSIDVNEQLISTILSIEGGSISICAFRLIVEFLEEQAKVDSFQVNFFNTYMEILKLAEKDIQIRALEELLNNFKMNHSFIRYAIASEFLTMILLSLASFKSYEVLDEMFELIKFLASEYISVRQVKIIFNLFQVQDVHFTSYYWQKIFPLMQSLWNDCADSPDAFFDFNGSDGAILNLEWSLSAKSGYSIFTWFKISSRRGAGFGAHESAIKACDDYRNANCPYLFSFLTENGMGFEAYFYHDELVICFNGKFKDTSRRKYEKINFNFLENVWYFITITHVYRVIVPDEFFFYVNGELVYKKNIKFTRSNLVFTQSSLGNNTASLLDSRFAFKGLMTGFAVLDGYLTQDLVKDLYRSGLNLFKSSYKIRKNLEHVKKSKFAIFCTPFNIKGKHCYDPSSQIGQRIFEMLPGVTVCNNVKFRVSLFNLGGIQLLLPLFSPLYRPPIDKDIDVNDRLIAFITELIQENPYYQNQMQRMHFFEIMGHLFWKDFEPSGDKNGIDARSFKKRNAAANKWSTQSIVLLNNLAVSIMPLGATNSTKTNGIFYRQFFTNIYMNFKVWSNTDFEVQKKVLEVIIEHIVIDAEFFHSFISIRDLMVILKEFYSYPTGFRGMSSWKSEEKDLRQLVNFNNSNLDEKKLLTLRRILLNIVKIFLRSAQLKLDEISSIFSYLNYELQHRNSEELLACDVLEMLLTITAEARQPFLDYINKLGNITQFFPFLELEKEEVRIIVLKIIAKYCQVQTSYFDSVVLEKKGESVQQSKEEISARQQAHSVKFATVKSLCVLRKLLERYPFTIRVYRGLIEILVEYPYEKSHLDVKESKENKTFFLFKNTLMIPIIFYLAKKSNDIRIQIMLIDDMVFFLKQNFQNRLSFMKENYWQRWVLSLIEFEGEGEGEEADRWRLVDSIIRFFTLIFETSFVFPSCAKSLFHVTGAVIGGLRNIGKLILYILNNLHASIVEFVDRNSILDKCGSSALTYQVFLSYLDFLISMMFMGSQKGNVNLYFNGRDLLPFSIKYEGEEFWTSFGLIQKALVLTDRLMAVGSFLEVSEGIMGGGGDVELFLMRIRMRLLLHSIWQILSLKSSLNLLRKRKEAMKGMKSIIGSVVRDGMRVDYEALLERYFETKKSQWKSEFLDSDIILQENIKQLSILLGHDAISRDLFFYGVVFLYVILKILRNKNENERVLLNLLLLKRRKGVDEGGRGGDWKVQDDLNSLSAVSDEILQLTTSLWKEAILKVKRVLQDEGEYDKCFGGDAAEVMDDDEGLLKFFEDGLTDMKAFSLSGLFDVSVSEVIGFELERFKQYVELVDMIRGKFQDQNFGLSEDENEAIDRIIMEYKMDFQRSVEEFESELKDFRIRSLQHSSIIASEWKNFIQILIEARVPCGNLKEGKFYWMLDSSENSQRMRVKLKRCYKNIKNLEYASRAGSGRNLECASRAGSGGLQGGQKDVDLGPNFSENEKLLLRVGLREKGVSVGVFDRESANDDWEGTAELEVEAAVVDSTLSRVELGTDFLRSSLRGGEGDTSTGFKMRYRMQEEKVVFATSCLYVKGIETTEGEFEITSLSVRFRNFFCGVFKSIPLDKIKYIYSRRYMLRNTALEIFTIGGKSHFYNFDKANSRSVMEKIIWQKPPNLREYFLGSSTQLANKRQHITEAWKCRKISNFEYLMKLNDMAGRSYNDITQYPIFPWVIKDYVSKKIDLNDSEIYRDLSKPIGALDEGRLSKILERWELMLGDDNANNPPFMYGSHYSTSSIVLYFLIRLEPFTMQAINLQGGKFDIPARMFWSIPETWNNILTNSSDVKELIPEFFFLPEFLLNMNDVDLGHANKNVELPPWAPNAHTFVQMNLMALESEYVSAHLHEWIDLIFGYKQLGQDAIDACNVFHYLSYEGSIDIDSIEDPVLKQSVQMQIREFGQTPTQIFTEPHPRRFSLEESIKYRHGDDSSYSRKTNFKKLQSLRFNSADLFNSKVLIENSDYEIVAFLMDQTKERILVVFADGLVVPVKYVIYVKEEDNSIPEIEILRCTLDGNLLSSNDDKAIYYYLENVSLTLPGSLLSRSFAFSPNGKVIYHCGTWDHSICITSVSSTLTLQNIVYKHEDVITSLAISHEGSILATSSKDCSIHTFCIENGDGKDGGDASNRCFVALKLMHTLLGHEDTVNALTINSDLNILVSASQDGTCNIYELIKGKFCRVIDHKTPVTLVAITKYGVIVSYCPKNEMLFLHSVNGILIQKLSNIGKVTSLKLTENGLFVLLAIECSIVLRSLYQYSLKILNIWKFSSPISAIQPFKDDDFLLVGTSDGHVISLILNYSDILVNLAKIQ